MNEELKKYADLVNELELLDHKTFFTWYNDNFDRIQEENNEDLEIYLRYRIEKYLFSGLFYDK